VEKVKRITIVGPSGSGKSTLARILGEKYHLPIFHMDQLFFNPGWVEKSREELQEAVEKILAENEQWVFEGNYSGTLPPRLEKSTHVYFIDYPRHIYVRRVLKRTLTSYGQVRKDMAPGCPERIDPAFLKYVWEFKTKRRDRLMEQVQNLLPKDCVFIVVKHPKELERHLNTLD
jgi:adenylate kinase family enzyme